jgi:hypothetical protein
MQATNLIPKQLEAFKLEISHLKGAPATEDNKAEGTAIIHHHATRLQLLDLSLNLQAARDLLATAYRQI